jgi:hypothetical protein
MPTETNNGSTEDISGQEQQGQQQETTDDTSGNGSQTQTNQEQQAPAVTKDTVLPDDHPVVKQLKDDKAKLATARQELAEARAQAGKATQLQEELDKRPTQEALDTLQTRYERLEAFTQAIGLGKALDSRTFTKDLFETDKPVDQLVKDFNKANPSVTSTALGSAAAAPADKKPDPNALLRAAAGK